MPLIKSFLTRVIVLLKSWFRSTRIEVCYESKEKHQARQACFYLDCWNYSFSEGIKRVQRKTGLQMQVSVDNPDLAEIGEIDDICRRKVQNREEEDELHVV